MANLTEFYIGCIYNGMSGSFKKLTKNLFMIFCMYFKNFHFILQLYVIELEDTCI